MYVTSCDLGKANGAPPTKLVLVGSIPTPKFFMQFMKNFEGGRLTMTPTALFGG